MQTQIVVGAEKRLSLGNYPQVQREGVVFVFIPITQLSAQLGIPLPENPSKRTIVLQFVILALKKYFRETGVKVSYRALTAHYPGRRARWKIAPFTGYRLFQTLPESAWPIAGDYNAAASFVLQLMRGEGVLEKKIIVLTDN